MVFMGVANYQKFCKLVEIGRGEKRCCMKRHIIEFSVKSGKHSTKTLSLVQNQVRFFENLEKKYISLQQGDETQKCTIFFVVN
jgi:hypothetical protein